MPQPTTNEPSPRPSRFPLRGLLGLVGLLVLLAYLSARDANEWKLAQAERVQANPAQALKYVDEVLAQDPQNLDALHMRIELLVLAGDTQGAVQAVSDALKLKKLPPDAQLSWLERRAELRQRIGQHREAMGDADTLLAIAQRSVQGAERDKLIVLMGRRNARAYVVARAAAAGQASPAQVAAAQRDMQQAFAGLEALRRSRIQPDESQLNDDWKREAMFLDTAGYLELAAGDLPAALRDLNRALQLAELMELLIRRIASQLPLESRDALQRSLQEIRAVVLHHRGEVLLAMGNRRDGQINIQLALRQGYNRDKGPW